MLQIWKTLVKVIVKMKVTLFYLGNGELLILAEVRIDYYKSLIRPASG